MPEPTNVLKRLCDILNQVLSQEQTFSNETSASRIWMRGLDLADGAALNDFLCDLIAATRSHERLVMRTEGINQDLHLSYINKVKECLLKINVITWGEFRQMMDQSTMDTLMALSEGTSTFWDEEVMPEDELWAILESINRLIVDVLDSDLSDVLKLAIVDGLDSARHAIESYSVFGAEGLKRAVEENIVVLARYREEFNRAFEGEDKSVITEYVNVMDTMDRVLSVGLKVQQISEGLPLLGMLTGQ